MNQTFLRRPLLQTAHERRIIHHRLRIGHGGNRRVAPRGGRPAAGYEVLLRLLPRLPEMNVHIDKPWRHYFPRGIDNLCPRRRQISTDFGNFSILNQNITDFI